MTDRERRILEEHGTKLMELKPSSIWAAAMEDLRRRDHNQSAAVDTMKQYAFHRDHVAGAETANDVIRAAIKDIEDAEVAVPENDDDPPIIGKGRSSGKRLTRLLYLDPDLLRAALK